MSQLTKAGNIKRESEYQRRYYAKNRERRIAESCAYQSKHADKRKAYNAAYYAANKDKLLADNKARRERNITETRARRKAEYAADPERFKRAVREWAAANPEKLFEQRVRKYGLTTEGYAALLSSQGGKCAICGRTHSIDKVKRSASGRRRLAIDHCHATGKVRGLLCSSCNFGLGKFRDDPTLLEVAAAYLRRAG